MFESMMPTLKAGKLDMGMAFIPSKGDDHLSMLLGVRVAEGAKVEELVRKLAAVPTKPDDDKVTLDVGKLGGISLHKVEPGPNGDKDAQELLGKGPGFFAVRPDAVLLGGGPEGMNLLKESIEAKTSPSPLLAVSLSFAQFSRFNSDRSIPRKKIEEAAKKAFGDKPESDRLKLLIESKDGLRTSMRLKTAVLTFFSELDPSKAN